jgi:hypothetical protein
MAQLEALPADLPRELSAERFALSHRLGTFANDWTAAVRFGENHFKLFPEAGKEPRFLLRLGESRFRNGDFNRARYLFSEVSAEAESGDLIDIALYFEARANLAIPTGEATTEALTILDRLLDRSGPLASEARILKAHTLLESLVRAEECLQTLTLLPGKLVDHPEALLLAAKAHRDLGTTDEAEYEKALALYRDLLAHPRTSYPRSNQLHYLIARTYRESGHPEIALEPCMAVVDFENRPAEGAPPEWDYYYQCGFEALDILLSAERHRAALLVARKLAKGKGPGAQQARKRAEQIQLENMLWTD